MSNASTERADRVCKWAHIILRGNLITPLTTTYALPWIDSTAPTIPFGDEWLPCCGSKCWPWERSSVRSRFRFRIVLRMRSPTLPRTLDTIASSHGIRFIAPLAGAGFDGEKICGANGSARIWVSVNNCVTLDRVLYVCLQNLQQHWMYEWKLVRVVKHQLHRLAKYLPVTRKTHFTVVTMSLPVARHLIANVPLV